jgi:hypothetical protein
VNFSWCVNHQQWKDCAHMCPELKFSVRILNCFPKWILKESQQIHANFRGRLYVVHVQVMNSSSWASLQTWTFLFERCEHWWRKGDRQYILIEPKQREISRILVRSQLLHCTCRDVSYEIYPVLGLLRQNAKREYIPFSAVVNQSTDCINLSSAPLGRTWNYSRSRPRGVANPADPAGR